MSKRTKKVGWSIGVLASLVGMGIALAAAPPGAPASTEPAAEETTAPEPAFVPTERIDVEVAVDFPYDI